MSENGRKVQQPRERRDRDGEEEGHAVSRGIDNRRGAAQMCNDVIEHAHTGVHEFGQGTKGDARGVGEGGQWHFVN